jgi:hypothetical protein
MFRTSFGMIYKKQRVILFSGKTNVNEEKKKDTIFFSRRVPNVNHSILGYQDSLESFYISACDVS